MAKSRNKSHLLTYIEQQTQQLHSQKVESTNTCTQNTFNSVIPEET